VSIYKKNDISDIDEASYSMDQALSNDSNFVAKRVLASLNGDADSDFLNFIEKKIIAPTSHFESDQRQKIINK
jgi:hypothetical protein